MYTYTTWVAAVASAAVTSTTDTDLLGILPSAIDYAEQRIWRDLDLLNQVVSDASTNATANKRSFTLPQDLGYFNRIDAVNIITPVGTTTSTGGTRNALVPASKEYLDFAWPSDTAASAATVPTYFCMVTDQSIRFGPPPGAAFNVEVRGIVRPVALSAGNPTTYLTLYLPDLFFAASMIFISGWQKNFGAQSDNPQMALSWEGIYGPLLASAKTEDAKRKMIGMATGVAA